MGTFTRAAAIAAFGLACAAVGAWWKGRDAATPAVAPAVASSTVAAAMPAPAAATTAVAAKAAEPDDEVAKEASPGHDTARQIVASAVARGSWRPEDAQGFRDVLGGLTHGETVEVLDELSRAINTGRLHVVARDRPTF
jgi:hypothetical protein